MLTAGTYWIGDLRYVLSDDEWESVQYVVSDSRFGEHTLPNGKSYAIYSTVFGEGVFCDNFDREYYSATGTVGCVSTQNAVAVPSFGNVLRFKYDFQTGYLDDAECIIFFGNVEINTTIVEN
jgi:hypothetical protein